MQDVAPPPTHIAGWLSCAISLSFVTQKGNGETASCPTLLGEFYIIYNLQLLITRQPGRGGDWDTIKIMFYLEVHIERFVPSAGDCKADGSITGLNLPLKLLETLT